VAEVTDRAERQPTVDRPAVTHAFDQLAGPDGLTTNASTFARRAWQLDGYQVLGTAPTGIATVCLDSEGFEHARTVGRLLAELDQ
jgi:hypothetical protein